MTQPTLVAFSKSNWTDTGTAANATASFTWVSGDVMEVLGGTCDTGVTFAAPTTAGSNMGTFNQVTAVTAASSARAYYWKATATGSGSGTITASCTGGGGGAANVGGIGVWQYRATTGEGTPVTLSASASKTMNVTRATTNCHIIQVLVDWNEVGDVVTDPTPATNATERETSAVAGQADFFVMDWGDQGATGTTAYGLTNHTGTVKITGISVEIKGATTQSFSYTGAGGLTFASTGARNYVRATAPSGGLTFASTAAQLKKTTPSPTGGITFASTAQKNIGFSTTGAGGISFAGVGVPVKKATKPPSGGVIFGGAATFSSSGAQTFTYTGTGGISFASTAARFYRRATSPAGGIIFGGSASYINIPVGGGSASIFGTRRLFGYIRRGR